MVTLILDPRIVSRIEETFRTTPMPHNVSNSVLVSLENGIKQGENLHKEYIAAQEELKRLATTPLETE